MNSERRWHQVDCHEKRASGSKTLISTEEIGAIQSPVTLITMNNLEVQGSSGVDTTSHQKD